MKSIFKIRTAVSLAMCVMFALVLFSGCSKDDNDVRDGYVGNYRVFQRFVIAGTIYESNYNITISKSLVSKSDIIISNIIDAGQGVQVIAIVNGDSFMIPQQTIEGEGISGSGRKAGNTLDFSVLVTFDLLGQASGTLTATRM